MVYIILPVFNRIQKTKSFLESLLTQTFQSYHLILVDDGSTDGTHEYVIGRIDKDKLTILKFRGGLWWAGSLQKGYNWITRNKKVSPDDFVLIMNNDTTFDTLFLENGVEFLKDKKDTLLTSYAYSLADNELLDAGVHIDWETFECKGVNDIKMINCLSTRGLLMHVSTFKKIGGFHPILLPHYLSDYEYTHRAYKMGMTLTTDSSFRLNVDETTSGFVEFESKNFWQYFKHLFSKRNKVNPVYHLTFIILTCPINFFKKRHVIMIIKEFARNVRNEFKKNKSYAKR